jgi:hypothetical protein
MYIITKTTTKPAEAQWFSQANPAVYAQLRAWEQEQPGFCHIIATSKTDTEAVQEFEFKTEADYQAYLVALETNPYEQIRQAHNSLHNIVEL